MTSARAIVNLPVSAQINVRLLESTDKFWTCPKISQRPVQMSMDWRRCRQTHEGCGGRCTASSWIYADTSDKIS